MHDVLNVEIKEIIDIKYYLTIYGRIPESGLMVSFRRVGKQRSYGRKIVKCPYCTSRLTDTDTDTKIDVLTVSESQPVDYNLLLNCNNCNRDVGVNIIIPAY